MNTPAKLSLFTLGLATVFGLAFGAGHLIGPVTSSAETTAHSGMGHGGHEVMPSPGSQPGGLLVSDHGYTLTRAPGASGEFAFRIVGPAGRTVTAFDTEHDKRMHFIVVRRDLSGFRHVHPRMDADGTWRVASPLDGPGIFWRDGRPVTDLQPYLGSYGHLVALRDGDLAYLHVHPNGAPGDGRTRPGPEITFYAEVPSPGTYRLYLDFQHGGKIHTAPFTAVATSATAPAKPSSDHQH